MGIDSYWRQLTGLQRGALFFGTTFLCYLVSAATIASHAKGSGRSLASQNSQLDAGTGKEDSLLLLKDFSRIMLRRGKKNLEVRAQSGKFLPEEHVTYLTEAEVTVQRDSGKPIKIRARNAKLFMDGEQLRLANMEGNVVVVLDDGTELHTELASYDAEAQLIRGPEEVNILGKGFTITGDGMETEVDNEVVKLLRDTHSRFERGAELPKLSDTN